MKRSADDLDGVCLLERHQLHKKVRTRGIILTRFLAITVVLAVLLSCSTRTFADEPEVATENTPTQENTPVISAADIIARADADERFVQRANALGGQSGSITGLEKSLDKLSGRILALSDKFKRYELKSVSSPLRLEDLDRYWKFYDGRLAVWRDQLQRVSERYSAAAAELSERRAIWEATLRHSHNGSLPPALAKRIREILSQLDNAEQVVAAPLTKVLELARRGNVLQADCDSARAALNAAFSNLDYRLLHIDAAPLPAIKWSDIKLSRPNLAALHDEQAIQIEFLKDYTAAYAWQGIAFEIGTVVLLIGLVRMGRRSAALHPDDGTDDLETPVLQRPVSSWLVITLVGLLYIAPDAPVLLQKAALALLLVPVLRLLPKRTYKVLGSWPVVLTVFYLFYQSGYLLIGLPVYLRLHLMVAGLLSLLWLLMFISRIQHQQETAAIAVHRAAVVMLGWIFIAAAATGIVSNITGNVSLAQAMIDGVVQGSQASLLLYLANMVARTVVTLLLRHSEAIKSRISVKRRDELLSRGIRMLNIVTLVVWSIVILRVFYLLHPASIWVGYVLKQPMVIGHLSITLASILVFIFSVVLSVWLARMIRYTLREAVVPHMDLPRGIGDSIATLSYYALIVAGFLFALVAAGFHLNQLAIAFGALGVGIGFGLQSIARDVVSGMVLLFERPLRLGDWVQLEDLIGVVTDVGIRATRVRSTDGAEVVVPNGNLVSGNVINWTLSDRRHRIHVLTDTAYGTDPEKVLDILNNAAKSHPDVLAWPHPLALFTGFGDSSLNFELRVWAQNTDRGWQAAIQSDLAIAINKAFVESGIEVPFPQRDLHLRSISPEVRAGLQSKGSKATGGE